MSKWLIGYSVDYVMEVEADTELEAQNIGENADIGEFTKVCGELTVEQQDS